MAFLIVNESDVIKEGASEYANVSGLYDVNIKAVEIKGTSGGATQANYLMDKAMSYGNTVINKQGKPIFGFRIMEALAVIIGESELSDPEATEVKFKNSTKDLMCIPELTDVDVKVWLQFEYSLWEGTVQENVRVKRFYRASDGASGKEILEGTEAGKQLEKDTAYHDTVKYDDGLDAEQIAEWKKAEAEGRKAKPAETTSSAGAAAAFPS